MVRACGRIDARSVWQRKAVYLMVAKQQKKRKERARVPVAF